MIKGRVFKYGDTWHYVVSRNGQVYFADNTGDWRVVFDQCREDVAVMERIVRAGHEFKQTWPEILSKRV